MLGQTPDIDMLLFSQGGSGRRINAVGELHHFTGNNPHIDSFDQDQETTSALFTCNVSS